MTETHKFNHQTYAIHTLRVNLKSLIAESRIIRLETRRCGIQYKDRLHLHRVGKLRFELRHACLALCYLRGRKYKQAEPKSFTSPNVEAIQAKLKRHGITVPIINLVDWIAGE
jgi:hypothetical protein